jgi:hypothetical protein
VQWAVTAYVLALGVVMPGLSGASGAERMALPHRFLAAAIAALAGAAAVALLAPTGGQKSAA